MSTKVNSSFVRPKLRSTATTTGGSSIGSIGKVAIGIKEDKIVDKENKVSKKKAEDKVEKDTSGGSSNKGMLSLSPSASSSRINEEGLEDLRTAFCLLDKNSDGRVSTSEMQFMLKTFGIDVPYKHVRRMVDRADRSWTSGSGASKGLTESDFIEWIKPLLLETAQEHEERYSGRSDIEQDLLAAFQIFDKDGNGYITKDELKRAMEIIGEDVSDEELNEMLDIGDIDKDGKIDYGEFAKILT